MNIKDIFLKKPNKSEAKPQHLTYTNIEKDCLRKLFSFDYFYLHKPRSCLKTITRSTAENIYPAYKPS